MSPYNGLNGREFVLWGCLYIQLFWHCSVGLLFGSDFNTLSANSMWMASCRHVIWTILTIHHCRCVVVNINCLCTPTQWPMCSKLNDPFLRIFVWYIAFPRRGWILCQRMVSVNVRGLVQERESNLTAKLVKAHYQSCNSIYNTCTIRMCLHSWDSSWKKSADDKRERSARLQASVDSADFAK